MKKFCQKHGRDDLKKNIWNHIKSFSDLLNSCYIPVNCWIVSTILFESVKADPALPTTLTELYPAAVAHLDKEHFRKVDGLSYENATKKLALLAFNGIEPMQLIFDNKSFDEQMKQSGLLNSFSNPYYQVQTQFCFIHLTIQEFLAAKLVTQTFSPEKINEFIFSHIKSGKWHLVLQFIAGLLGKEIKMFQKYHYKECVLAFAKSFELTSEVGMFDVTSNYASLLIMKCLREVKDQEIVEEACKATAINDIVDLTLDIFSQVKLSPSDWSSVFFVCKHMKNLKKLYLEGSHLSRESYLEAFKFILQQRCVEELWLRRQPSGSSGNIFKILMESKCSLHHSKQCRKLIKLTIDDHRVTDEILLSMCEFFRNGYAICLKDLHLVKCEIGSRKLSILCEVLDNRLCPELTCLDPGRNDIADEGLTELCKTLTKQRLSKLTELDLFSCSLTKECVPALIELLRNECCNLINLTLGDNRGINDDGLRILGEHALTKEHCKLVKLNLSFCSLTDDCLLEKKNCKLISLLLGNNRITDEGLHVLCDRALTKEHFVTLLH